MSESSENRSEEEAQVKLKNNALSFRLGPTHIERLREISMWRDRSQADILRTLIDKEHRSVKASREAILMGKAQ